MYSPAPTVLGQYQIDCRELMFVQYMPIIMPGYAERLPRNLACFQPLLEAIISEDRKPWFDDGEYAYLTAKRLFVGPNCLGNRPGWHTDGFGTDDINYIWSDSMPTEFCVQNFDLSDDHEDSLLQMEVQAFNWNIQTLPVGSLLKLDRRMVHRAPHPVIEGYRTFVKISVSRERYNLIGNAHNYLFDYDWPMVERQVARNHPIGVAV